MDAKECQKPAVSGHLSRVVSEIRFSGFARTLSVVDAETPESKHTLTKNTAYIFRSSTN